MSFSSPSPPAAVPAPVIEQAPPESTPTFGGTPQIGSKPQASPAQPTFLGGMAATGGQMYSPTLLGGMGGGLGGSKAA